jgi:Delta14-sterol reductase
MNWTLKHSAAFSTFLFAMGITAGIIWRFGAGSFTFFYDRWVGFCTAALLNSVLQAVYVYLASFREGKQLALGGNTGNVIYDVNFLQAQFSPNMGPNFSLQFFIGRELNPSIGSFDIKSFNELRPGLILWVLIDISMACEQALRNGGKVTDSMWLVLLFQIGYVADGLYNEASTLMLGWTYPNKRDSQQSSPLWTSPPTVSASCFLVSLIAVVTRVPLLTPMIPSR